ncbi:MAG: HDOD domain-containing protein, partial [Pseudomonadota bacterium]
MLAQELQTKLASIRDLPSPPKIAQELIEIAEQADVSLGAVSAVIEKDPALSARLLRVANSTLYSRQ